MNPVLKRNVVFLFFLLFSMTSFAQRQISITIDDPTTKASPKFTWQERDNAILNTLEKHKVKVALFVCGMRVDDSNGKDLLKKWDANGHLICNHSYSHLNFNSGAKTGDVFISDFIKGDSVIREYKNYTKLFRFPFLKEGNTAEKRDSMRVAMKQLGYNNGHVTIDASDWYIDSKITEALIKDPNANLTVYRDYYIRHILNRAHYYDSLSRKLFKRDIKHTLLIHHSLLNALFLDDLLTAIKNDGWDLIDVKEAYKDSVFSTQPLIVPCGESIIWQSAKSDDDISKTLRYPAEDGEYEKEPLLKAIKAYGKLK